MWAAALVGLLAGGPFGVCLLLAAGITQGIKVWKVDANWANQGKTPPSYALVEKWLDNRKAAGKAPKAAKVKPYGSWAYAKQRWQAMWEDLGDTHRTVRGQYRQAAAAAEARGEQPPPKPTFKETLTGWKWHIDQLTAPTEALTPAHDPTVPAVQPAASPQQPDPADLGHAEPVETGSLRIDPGHVQELYGTNYDPPPGYPGAASKPATSLYELGPRNCVACAQPGQVVERADGRTFVHDRTGNRCPAIEPDPADTPNTHPQQPSTSTNRTEGALVTTPAQQSGEVTGIPSAIHYLQRLAEIHTAVGGNETLIARMADMKIGAADIAKVQAAMQASLGAADQFTLAADTIALHNQGVREAYASAPDAADKQHQMAE